MQQSRLSEFICAVGASPDSHAIIASLRDLIHQVVAISIFVMPSACPTNVRRGVEA
ncbi:MAG: hypothetical protein IID12_03980 [Candidatus Marinimicrobia bacterium]|nr:hypothetical protein [Candidatus Neomarinimicrobiota bacterium]